MTVTTITSSLAQVIGAATPFASRDITLPILSAVQLHAGGGVLTVTATDRYSIGHARQAATGQLSRPRYLHRRDAKALRQALTRHIEERESGTDPATISEDDDGHLVVTYGTATMRFFEPEGVDSYADLGAVLAALPTSSADGLHAPIGLSQRVLRPLTKAMAWDVYSPPRWTFDGPRKPVRVEIGDWFIAALMPLALRGDYEPVPVDMPAPTEAATR